MPEVSGAIAPSSSPAEAPAGWPVQWYRTHKPLPGFVIAAPGGKVHAVKSGPPGKERETLCSRSLSSSRRPAGCGWTLREGQEGEVTCGSCLRSLNSPMRNLTPGWSGESV